MKKVLRRLSEPSTWAGLAGLATLLGMSMEDYTQAVLAFAGTAGFILAVVVGEKGPENGGQ